MFLLNILLMRFMFLWPLCLLASESSVFCLPYVLLFISLDMKINTWSVKAKNKTTHIKIFISATIFLISKHLFCYPNFPFFLNRHFSNILGMKHSVGTQRMFMIVGFCLFYSLVSFLIFRGLCLEANRKLCAYFPCVSLEPSSTLSMPQTLCCGPYHLGPLTTGFPVDLTSRGTDGR